MISKKEFYLNSLLSLAKPGGEARLCSMESTDKLRPLINVEIIKGREYNYVGKLEARVEGLKLKSGKNVFEATCFEYNCFTETGIWTTAVKTSISKQIEGGTKYWVRGDLDKEGNVYVVDVGYIYQPTGEIVIKEYNTPIFSGGKIRTLADIGEGIKFIVLKKVTTIEVEEVLYTYGDYKDQRRLIRPYSKSLLKYTADNQKCDTEEIAINILNLLGTSYYKKRENQKLYKTKYYIDPTLVSTIEEALDKLYDLVDRDLESARYGSIPRYIATYTKPEDIYGEAADQNYEKKRFKCFEENCFESDAFAVYDNNLLISREVNTRAISWLLYAVCSYYSSVAQSNTEIRNKYLNFIEELSTFILSQYEGQNCLVRDGWTHNDVYKSSQVIGTRSTSTAVISCLALLKTYEIKKNSVYLDVATDIYNTVINNFRFKQDSMFMHSYENTNYSIESSYYGLLLSYMYNRGDIVVNLIQFLNSKIRSSYGSEIIYVEEEGSRGQVYTEAGNKITLESEEITENPSKLLYFNSFTKEEEDLWNIKEVLKYNTLLYSLIKEILNKGYPVSYYTKLRQSKEYLNKLQESKRSLLSGIVLTDGLSERFILDSSYAKINSVQDSKSLLFYRSFINDKLKYFWAVDFTWPSKEALSRKGNLGSILYSVSRALGNWYINLNNLIKSRSLRESTNEDLEVWGSDYSTKRFDRESDENYRERLIGIPSKLLNSKEAIEENLKQIEIVVEVEDKWKEIVKTANYLNDPGNSVWGEGLYAGPEKATTNLIKVCTNQPFNEEALEELKNSVSAGVKYIVEENLKFNVKGKKNKVDFRLSIINVQERCDGIASEAGARIDNEETSSTFSICLEDKVFSNSESIVQENTDYILQENQGEIGLEVNI